LSRTSEPRSTSAIQVFRTAARLSSFARAAFELGVSPSVVSRQIQLLEKGLGGRLFIKHRRIVELTPRGRELLLVTGPSLDVDGYSVTLGRGDGQRQEEERSPADLRREPSANR
jgi:hypothetical protein